MTEDYWNYILSLCLSVWFGLIFFLLKSSQAAPLSAHPWPHITGLALWPNNPPRIPPLAGPTLVSLKTLHHVQHRTPHFYFSLSPKLCPWACPHCPITGSPGPPRSELWSPGKRFMAEVDGSKWWQGCGLLLKMKALVPQSCPALCDPMDCSWPGSSVHGILQARIPEHCCYC